MITDDKRLSIFFNFFSAGSRIWHFVFVSEQMSKRKLTDLWHFFCNLAKIFKIYLFLEKQNALVWSYFICYSVALYLFYYYWDQGFDSKSLAFAKLKFTNLFSGSSGISATLGIAKTLFSLGTWKEEENSQQQNILTGGVCFLLTTSLLSEGFLIALYDFFPKERNSCKKNAIN